MPVDLVKSRLPEIPTTSGIYQFFDEKDEVLYVGKAKNLRKRLQSYSRIKGLSNRIARMVYLAQKLEYVQTKTEVDALLLEHNLIKKLSPRYNILLKDGKTFPQILLTDHQFPRITKHRGSRSEKGIYFGPFASAYNVNHTIEILRKSFRIRSCTDAEFRSRTKPCMEYQIKRCSAPCVGMISPEEYKNSLTDALDFLRGKSAEVQSKLQQKMLQKSQTQDYEAAAVLRDQIKTLNTIQVRQNINVSELNNADVITAVIKSPNQPLDLLNQTNPSSDLTEPNLNLAQANETNLNAKVCIYISFFRNGQNYGARPYFYNLEDSENLGKIVSDFLGQFYLEQTPPELLLFNCEIEDQKIMEEFLSQIAERKVEIKIPKIGPRAALVKDQAGIALQTLEQKLSVGIKNEALLLELKNIFELSKIPQRIEVYDNSHTSGTNAVGVLITAGREGFIKSGYRKFNIRKNDADWGGKDDTSMIREVLTRRFSKLEKKEWPDFIIIDGGKPQLTTAAKVFNELQIEIPFICMAKGENRNAGEEKFYRAGSDGLAEQLASDLPKHHPLMHYLQRLRDEAHRFAIMTHRKRRGKDLLQ